MCQVVAYRSLKIIENSKTVRRKSGRSRLREVVVSYVRFQYKALTENIFGVLGRWSLIGGYEVVAHGRWSHVQVRLYIISYHVNCIGNFILGPVVFPGSGFYLRV